MHSQENAATGFQRCNRCWAPVADQFYRTSCLHVFCKSCCFEHFSNQKNCPLCNTILGDDDFAEPIDVGVGLQRSPVSAIFMEAFATNQFEDVAQTALAFTAGLEEFLCFLLTQLNVECQRLDSARERSYQENKQLKSDTANLGTRYRIDMEKLKTNLKEMENRLNLREKELRDARTAFEEERRKCHAYEKLNKRRSGSMSSPSGTPPISPQAAPQEFHQQGQRGYEQSRRNRYAPSSALDQSQAQGWNRGPGGVSPLARQQQQHSSGPFSFGGIGHGPSSNSPLAHMPGTPSSRHANNLAHRLSPVRQPMMAIPFRPAQTKFSPGTALTRRRR